MKVQVNACVNLGMSSIVRPIVQMNELPKLRINPPFLNESRKMCIISTKSTETHVDESLLRRFLTVNVVGPSTRDLG